MAATEDALAVAMLRHHFGPLVAEAARILLVFPGCTLSEFYLRTKPFCDTLKVDGEGPKANGLRRNLIRDSLSVLLQHGIAFSFERRISKDNAPKDVPKNVYYLNTAIALYRTRLPLYYAFVRHTYGEVGGEALMTLFQGGRMTAKYIIKQVQKNLKGVMDMSDEQVEGCLIDMARSSIIKPSGMRKARKSIAHDDSDDDHDDDEPLITAGTKRPRSELDTDDITSNYQTMIVIQGSRTVRIGEPSRQNDNDLWTLGYWRLNRQFRNRCCAMIVQKRLMGNELANRIFQLGMKLALDMEDCDAPGDESETRYVSLSQIEEQLKEISAGKLDSTEFAEAVKMLTDQNPKFVVGRPFNSPSEIMFIPGQLVAETRLATVDELVTNRYGQLGRRVFSAMAIEGGMEEGVLANKCMMPLKVVREQLYSMYKDRIVVMQEVPRSSDQVRSSNWYYLWKVNPMEVFRNVNEVIYKTTLNLLLKLESLEAERTVDEKEAKKLERQRQLLSLSILRMDQSIMMLRDFGPISSLYLPAKYSIVDGCMGKEKRKR